MKRIFIYFIGLIYFASCAPLPEDSKSSSVVLKMPTSNHFKRSSNSVRKIKAVGTTTGFAGVDIQNLDDIDCYTVAIGQDSGGSCQGDKTYSQLKFLSFTVPDGGIITMNEIPSEVPLAFHVIGFSKGSLAACPDLRHITPSDMAQMGRPAVVGLVNQILEPIAENTVDINISMTTANFLNSCSGGPFNWQVGGIFGSAIFGQAKFGP